MATAGGTGAVRGAGAMAGIEGVPVVGLVPMGVGPAGPGREEEPGPGGGRGGVLGEQAEDGEEGDTVCLNRRELQDLLRRVRGLERLIGRVLGGVGAG